MPTDYDFIGTNSINKHYLDDAREILKQYDKGLSCANQAAARHWPASKVRHYVRVARRLTLSTQTLCRRNPRLSFGHARALAGFQPSEQIEMARSALSKHWSVRMLEQQQNKTELPDEAYYQHLSENLSEQLGHPLLVEPDKSKASDGLITIRYFGFDDFDSICSRLGIEVS